MMSRGVAPIAFKPWKLSKALRVVSRVGGLAGIVGLLWVIFRWGDSPLLSPGGITSALALAVVSFGLARVGLQWIVQVINYRKSVYQIATGAALSLVGWAVAGVHLRVFDPLFLRKGRLPRVKEEQTSGGA